MKTQQEAVKHPNQDVLQVILEKKCENNVNDLVENDLASFERFAENSAAEHLELSKMAKDISKANKEFVGTLLEQKKGEEEDVEELKKLDEEVKKQEKIDEQIAKGNCGM